MASARDSGRDAIADYPDVRYKLNDELHELDARLQTMVDAYQEKPSVIDNAILDNTSYAVDVDRVITEVYQIMKTRIYAQDSPLRADTDVWEAFKEQKDEFIDFYKSALRALETYREVLQAYNLMNREASPLLQRGDLERIRQDKRTHVEERERCIKAISEFHGKFSAMLVILFTDRIS